MELKILYSQLPVHSDQQSDLAELVLGLVLGLELGLISGLSGLELVFAGLVWMPE